MRQLNVLGEELQPCSLDPLTGYYRTGCCENRGDDLSTPMPEHGFAGLSEGDQWCLCAARWQEAFEAGAAPMVRLAATHLSALEYSSLADLRAHAVDG
jgi:uncharacterized protein